MFIATKSSAPMQFNDIIQGEFPCPVCLNNDRKLVSRIGRNLQDLTTVICTNCGLLHGDPIPSKAELEVFYAESYRKKYKGCRKPKLKHLIRYAPDAYMLARRLSLRPTCLRPKWLDIGSGSGEFLYMAKLLGIPAEGVEPNRGYAEFAIKELDLKVQNCEYDKAKLKRNSYSAVNLNHVLEHMRDPFAVLEFINDLLLPGGLLSVAVPDCERMSHSPWTQFHYAHIYNFNHATIRGLLFKAGFDVIAGKETSLIATKNRPSDASMAIAMPENFHLLWDKLISHSSTAHLRSRRPYSRFLRKCRQYPQEWLASLTFRTPKNALGAIFAKLERTDATNPCDYSDSPQSEFCKSSYIVS